MNYKTIEHLNDGDSKQLTGVRSKKFRLPGNKVLQASGTVFEGVLVDVS